MIYIIANANAISGGPELLHQCCGAFRKQGFEAKMLYFNKTRFPAKPSENVTRLYGGYDVDYTLAIEDKAENSVIFPETVLFLFPKFKHARKVVWWLSVDAYFSSMKTKVARWYAPFGMKWKKYNPFDKAVTHCCQSEYAMQFLGKRVMDSHIYELSDYLSAEFMEDTQDESSHSKQDVVLYNPRKGYVFTQKIMGKLPQVKWMPLRGYTHQEMVDIMKKSKVYIDFGHHPGKDRIPREAAMCGCCIITGKDGSAQNDVDVPILNEYKFEASDNNIERIASCVLLCINNYWIKRKDFDKYREIIRGEKNKFENDIKMIGKLFADEKTIEGNV